MESKMIFVFLLLCFQNIQFYVCLYKSPTLFTSFQHSEEFKGLSFNKMSLQNDILPPRLTKTYNITFVTRTGDIHMSLKWCKKNNYSTNQLIIDKSFGLIVKKMADV